MPTQLDLLDQPIEKFAALSYLLAQEIDELETHELNSILNERGDALDAIQDLITKGAQLTLEQRQKLSRAEGAAMSKMNQVRSTLRTEFENHSRQRNGRQAYWAGSTKTYELTG
ncbi:MAG: hypothetical protein KF824_09795 [Fimbriimonadaceae bacterium]|nr:MAG: hypothetical protein KF824_09795 [Fimbriimonadaceae bacterium]